jgi:hypothetical protein
MKRKNRKKHNRARVNLEIKLEDGLFTIHRIPKKGDPVLLCETSDLNEFIDAYDELLGKYKIKLTHREYKKYLSIIHS